MSDHASVLFANEAFYIAFANKDLEAMTEVWAKVAAITCIHPGWLVLTDRDEVMASWEAILTGPGSPEIFCEQAVAHVVGDTAYVICYEVVDRDTLLATNVFVRESRAWKMVHHQAGAAPPPPVEDDDPPPNMMQ